MVFAEGRFKFLPNNTSDPADPSKKGDRIDNRNLINEWDAKMTAANLKHKFVWNIADFNSVKPGENDHVLGLLGWDHLEFDIDRKRVVPPQESSIAEMTLKVIDLLKANPNGYAGYGYFLLVEGGKIDHGKI
jgi:alkaline phosphatase